MSFGELSVSKNHCLYGETEYKSMPLMAGHLPMIKECLDALHRVVENSLRDYRRVFAFRVDLHVPLALESSADDYCNSSISRFIESFKAKIRHNRRAVAKARGFVHETSVRYFWVREIGDTGWVHYHLVIFLNGDAFNWLGNYQSPTGNIASRVCEAWASALGESIEDTKSKVHFPLNPSYLLVRDDQESVDTFFHRASYLCKARTKRYGSGHHGYGASRG